MFCAGPRCTASGDHRGPQGAGPTARREAWTTARSDPVRTSSIGSPLSSAGSSRGRRLILAAHLRQLVVNRESRNSQSGLTGSCNVWSAKSVPWPARSKAPCPSRPRFAHLRASSAVSPCGQSRLGASCGCQQLTVMTECRQGGLERGTVGATHPDLTSTCDERVGRSGSACIPFYGPGE